MTDDESTSTPPGGGTSPRRRPGRRSPHPDPGARLSDHVYEGQPSTPDGDPLLARWFVLAMAVLVVAAVAVTVWAFVEFGGREESTPADRRPPGTAQVTHERGDAVLNEVEETEAAAGCAQGITLFGDAGARATTRRALSAACQLLSSDQFPDAAAGLQAWKARDGLLRVATFELTGTESSARVEDGAVVLELSPRFQFDDATRAAPFILHELVHLGSGTWPGAPVTAEQELAATAVTDRACERLSLGEDPPLGCVDAADLLDDVDPLRSLLEAGYERGG